MFRQGRHDEAEARLDEAAEKAADDDVVTHVFVRAGRAKLGALRGSMESAESLAREALALARETEVVDLQGESLLALGQVLRVRGREAEAGEAIREAQAVWEAKGNVVFAGRAWSAASAPPPPGP
jgi:ATP/maltotriose-dependent transcriptional regulator MalT